MQKESKDQKVTDSIPRVAVLQILQVLHHIADSGGKSTFEKVRLFLLQRSQRATPSSRFAMYTIARDVLIDLQKLQLVQTGILPRTQSQMESLAEAPCELTEAGHSLAEVYKERPGHAFDQLLVTWINNHPYFHAFIVRLHQQPLCVPDITSVKQLGSEVRSEENLNTLSHRIVDHCLKRLSNMPFPRTKEEPFTHAVGERVQELGRMTLSGLDAKKWVDTIQDKVVIPSLLTAEELPFTDAVTFQHVLKAAKDFFAASWTASHPELSLRVIFSTCDFQPPAIDSQASITEVIHHGKSFAAPLFVAALRSAYSRVAKPVGSYADAYAVRAIVCIDLQIQPRVFAACLGDLMSTDPTPELTIYTELPFDSPPPGEDYIEIDRNRIGLLKLASS
ncbi:MAG: hypothetical protein HY268_25130 [Deltaproteobacteria bacterium]|nr:hypothetical protein [Deltaproteobacteria bacterium]